MKILVTGAKGFLGKNLITKLRSLNLYEVYDFDKDNSLEDLEKFTKDCNFVYHLAGINRPLNEAEFMEGNFGFTSTLLQALKNNNNFCPILITSSIQATLDNAYGKSKKAEEDLTKDYGKKNGVKVLAYRLQNAFGKWCKPNYNSVVATFCNNVASDLPIVVSNPETVLSLVYIDDIVKEFLAALNNNESKSTDGFYSIPTVYKKTLGEISSLLYGFKDSRINLQVVNQGDSFTKKLYATFLSYLPKDKFSYPLKMNSDSRGSFTEFLKTNIYGQVSVNVGKPHIVKGNHYHHTKNEKFLVVAGQGLILLRKVGETEILSYNVNGDKLEVIDIPCGYTHSIENVGETEMVTIMWANETFDAAEPDTYFEKV